MPIQHPDWKSFNSHEKRVIDKSAECWTVTALEKYCEPDKRWFYRAPSIYIAFFVRKMRINNTNTTIDENSQIR